MEILIKNIGLIYKADIELDGLTVITGKNDSGKSTVGKIMYSLVNSLNHYNDRVWIDAENYVKKQIDGFVQRLEKLQNEKEFIYNDLLELLYELFYDRLATFGEDDDNMVLLNGNMEYCEFNTKVQELLKFLENSNLDDEEIGSMYASLKEGYHHINSPLFLHETKRRKIETEFRDIFLQQIFNFYSKQNGEIAVPKWNDLKIEFDKNRIIDISKCDRENYSQFSDVTYIESPLVFNHLKKQFLRRSTSVGYEEDLIRKLLFTERKKTPNMFEDVLRSQHLELLDRKLADILQGDLKEDEGIWEELIYHLDGEEIRVQNLATGLKTFMIIRRLLDNNYLEEGSLLIIDEPEVHLHPEWQLKFAELIIVLMKSLKITVLLATHSPYFLNAIEVFSKKYDISENTHYYLAMREKNGAIFKNIDKNLSETYELLAELFQTLEDIPH